MTDIDKSATERPFPEDRGTSTATVDLAVQLSGLARTLQKEEDPDKLLAAMVHAAVELIPGAEDASISVVTGRKEVTSRAASGHLPEQVDALQNETGEGPCLDSAFEHRTVRVPDMASERRWPAFARRAAELGAGSMLAFQLFVEGDNLGALNLYAHGSGAFTDESEHIGLMVASHAAVAFAEARKAGQMDDALQTRDLIGQAKGILMERFKITGHQAFVMLSRLSQDNNTKLRDVADRLVVSGELEARTRSREPDAAEVR